MKRIYKAFVHMLFHIPEWVETRKTSIAEWIAILRKYPLYKHIRWTAEQKKEFKQYWKRVYGKKISSRWHRLYEACNGVHRIDYMPEIIYSTKMENKLNDPKYSSVLSNKNMLGLLLDGRIGGVRTPKIYLYNSNGFFYDGNHQLISAAKAMEILADIGDAVIKPVVDSSSGKNVAIICMKDGRNKRNGKTAEQILREYQQNFCVQEKILLHPQIAAVYPNAVNTFRVITYIANDKVETAPLSMRIGGGKSEIDNIHAGGMSISVKNDGHMGVYAYRLGYGNSFDKFDTHPDTGVKFQECQFSFVERMLEQAKQLHPLLPNIGMISWDFTVDSDENMVVIEMNLKGQSVWFPQMLSGESMFGENTEAVLRRKKIEDEL